MRIASAVRIFYFGGDTLTVAECSNYSSRIERLLRKLSDDKFNQTRSMIVSDPYSVLSVAVLYMYSENLLVRNEDFSDGFISKIEIFKGHRLDDFDEIFIEEFINELTNLIGGKL